MSSYVMRQTRLLSFSTLQRNVQKYFKDFEDQSCGNLTEKRSSNSCLRKRLAEARSQLISLVKYTASQNLRKCASGGKLKTLALKLSNTTLANLNKLEVWVQAVFKDQNDFWRRKHERVAERMENLKYLFAPEEMEKIKSEIDPEEMEKLKSEIAPEEMALLRNVSLILKKISVDYDRGRFLPTTWFEPTISKDQFPPVEEVQNALTRIQSFILQRGLPYYLHVKKGCPKYKLLERNCSYAQCEMEPWIYQYEMEHMMLPQLLGFELFGVMTISDCLLRANSEAERNVCWFTWEESSFYFRFRHPLLKLDGRLNQIFEYRNMQYLNWQSIIDTEMKKESACDCHQNEHKSIRNVKSDYEIICE